MDSGVSWKVVSQSETSAQLPDGTFGSGIKVTFQMSNGTVGSVFLAHATYNRENVMKAIQGKVASMTEVQNLTGTI